MPWNNSSKGNVIGCCRNNASEMPFMRYSLSQASTYVTNANHHDAPTKQYVSEIDFPHQVEIFVMNNVLHKQSSEEVAQETEFSPQHSDHVLFLGSSFFFKNTLAEFCNSVFTVVRFK